MGFGAEIGAAIGSAALNSVIPVFDRFRADKWRKEDIARADKLTRDQWNREDTAVQRRSSDLKAAGINPLLAAGSAASSSQPLYSSQQSHVDSGSQINLLESMMAKENIASTRAQRQLILAETDKVRDDNLRQQGIYDHNMSIVGNNPYGATPTVWGSLIGILRDWYNGKYKGGDGEKAIEKFYEDVSQTGIGKAEAQQIVRDLQNAERTEKAQEVFRDSQKGFWDWLESGFLGASPEANHY